MKIAEIREKIDHLNWARNDLSGHTKDEFKRANVEDRLQPLIDSCESIEIKARFASDRNRRDHAVESAKKMIDRWREGK